MANVNSKSTSATKQPIIGQDNDIYSDPAMKAPLMASGDLERVAFEDPFARMIINHWKQILLVVVAVAAGMYAKQVFDETQLASQRRAADLFGAVRTSYEQIIGLKNQRALANDELATALSAKPDQKDAATKDNKKPETKKSDPEEIKQRIAGLDTRISEREALLGQSITSLADAREPYRSLAGLYGELLRRIATNPMEGPSSEQTKLVELTSNWSKQSGELRLIAELSALAHARGLLDDDASLAQGVSSLKELSKDGKFVNSSAALTLARIAVTDSERAEALTILESVRSAHPEQGSLIDPELARLR